MPQIIKTESGEELVVLPRRDYDALRARIGDETAEDRMTEYLVQTAIAGGGASLPLEVWDEVEAAPSPIGPLRKHRGLTQEALAAKAQISQAYLSELEAGKKTGDVQTLRVLAKALSVSLDDVTPDAGEPAARAVRKRVKRPLKKSAKRPPSKTTAKSKARRSRKARSTRRPLAKKSA